MTALRGTLPPGGWPPTEPPGGSREPVSAAEWRAHMHPVLRRLAGWTWEEWSLPGPASDETLFGYRVAGGVLVAVFVQTDHVATARWTTVGPVPREIGVVHGSVAEVVAQIAAGWP